MQGIALMFGKNIERNSLKQRVIGYVRKGYLLNPRKGIYAKPGYDEKELGCLLYTPSYISLDYVLQRAGVIFQYSDTVYCIGNLSRSLEIDGKKYVYRKIKGSVLVDDTGIIHEGDTSIATPERALLDTLYLNSNYYFDHISHLDKKKLMEILPIYNCKRLAQRVMKLINSI